MRVLIQTLGSAGDVHPFIPIGATLRDMGHDVVVWGNEAFESVITGAGLAFVEAGTKAELEATMADPDLWHPRKGLDVVFEQGLVPSLEPTLDSMLERVEHGNTLVVGSTLGLASRMLRDIAKVPMVTLHLAPCAFRSTHRAPRLPGMWAPDWTPRWLKRAWWWLSDKVIDPMLCPALNELGEQYGLPPIRSAMGVWNHSPDKIVALFPDWFGPPQPDWPPQVVTTGFPLFDQAAGREVDEALHAWIDDGEAPIVVTAGSANVHGEAFYEASIDACRRLGRRALVITSNRALLPASLGDDVRHAAYAPFSRVLPKAAALVSHAGVGTCAQALAAGVPHLARPMAFDQPDNASRLEDLGVGASLPAARYNERRAAKMLARLLESETVQDACRRVAARMPSNDEVLREICEQIVSAADAAPTAS